MGHEIQADCKKLIIKILNFEFFFKKSNLKIVVDGNLSE